MWEEQEADIASILGISEQWTACYNQRIEFKRKKNYVVYPGEKHAVNCLHMNWWRISESDCLYFTHCLKQKCTVKTWPWGSHMFEYPRLFRYCIHLLIAKKTFTLDSRVLGDLTPVRSLALHTVLENYWEITRSVLSRLTYEITWNVLSRLTYTLPKSCLIFTFYLG